MSHMTDNIKDALANGDDKKDLIEQISLRLSPGRIFAIRKSERLLAAVHVVTNFIQQAEPLRVEIRSTALAILKLSVAPSIEEEAGGREFEQLTIQMTALLQAARDAGLVSSMNANLIGEEYAKLATYVHGIVPVADVLLPPTTVLGGTEHKGQKDRSIFRTVKRTSIDRVSIGHGADQGRRAEILKLFETKDRISIQDAMQAANGVSSKTIQRELLAMVESGILLKEGERRWSTYRRVER